MHRITSATSVTSKHWSARRPTPHLAAERWRLSHVAAWANSCTCCNISSGPLHGARSRSDAPVLDEPPLVAVLTDGAIGRWVAAPRRGTPRAHASLASGMRAPTATKKRRRPTHAPGLACASKRDLLRRHRTRSVTRLGAAGSECLFLVHNQLFFKIICVLRKASRHECCCASVDVVRAQDRQFSCSWASVRPECLFWQLGLYGLYARSTRSYEIAARLSRG